MKVSILTDGIYPLVIGGEQKQNWHLAKSLASEGIRVKVFYPESGSQSAFVNEKNIEEVPVKVKKGNNSFNDYQEELGRMVKNGSADVIYCQGLSGAAVIRKREAGKLDIPVVINLHGMEMFQPVIGFQQNQPELEEFRNEALYQMEHADAVVSLGGKIGNILHTHRIPTSKIFKIPAGIDSGWLSDPVAKDPQKRIFTFIGGEESRKGLRLLHQALEILSGRGIEPEVRIVGKVDPASRFKLNNIIYLGPVDSEEDIRKLLDESSILVLPSYCEGMPTVILEAMARGNAIITTDVGATSMLVDETNGMIVPVGDYQSLAEAMQHAAGLPWSRLMGMFQSSYSRVKDFEWPNISSRYVEMFEILKKGELQLASNL